jgi:RNA-directed DNA polymerase
MKGSVFYSVLASSLLAGEPTVDLASERLTRTLARRWRWIRPLVERYIKRFSGHTRPHRREVCEFLRHDQHFQEARAKYRKEIRIEYWLMESELMRPVPAAADWNLPRIESVGALAEWLALDLTDLLWLADLKGLASKLNRPPLQHYHYRILPKASGRPRLIEIPKPRLKDVQRQILFHVLNKVPPHPAAHGFVKSRSILSFVRPHVGRPIVLRMDLQDFFPTFPAARIAAFFRTAGYPESVADLLGGLCSTTAPRSLWLKSASDYGFENIYQARDMYSKPHLPQGAPTSPALANVCAYRMDCRLAGLARSVGAEYTRYADDLAFSGDESFARHVDRFSIHVAAILLEEGLSVNHRKTRIMRRGVRQHLAGIVANEHMNVTRADFDRLKAILTNCIRHGPGTQNRKLHPQFRSHLLGRVAFFESINPAKGERLRSIFEQIHWPERTGNEIKQ